MESMGSPHSHTTYIRPLPHNMLLDDYLISVDFIDEFEPVEAYCWSIVVDVDDIDFDTRLTFPCPKDSGCETRREYASLLRSVLTNWLSRLGFEPGVFECLAEDIGRFVLHNARNMHCCAPDPDGPLAMPVPYVSITHVSLVRDRVYGEEGVARAKRATDESIAALEEVRRVDLDRDGCCNGSCMVCLEDFDVEEQLGMVRMRCSHVFHKDCIVEWLKNSHVCPLCRFEMPSIEVEVEDEGC